MKQHIRRMLSEGIVDLTYIENNIFGNMIEF